MKILIADDHTVVREGLRRILRKITEIKQVDETSNGLDALQKIGGNHYDFVILDISLPGISGLEILKNLKSQNNSTRILVLSMHPEEQFAIRAFQLGALGYVTKDRAGEELILAIRKISSGGKYISPELAEYMAFNADEKHDRPIHEKLSKREFQIMIMLVKGKSSREIAEDLFISEKTVGTHRSRMMEKMGMTKKSELTYYAIQNKLIE
jgi:Response regulator containing a CheY-like receiver domain and an HTH DNA-binding domain